MKNSLLRWAEPLIHCGLAAGAKAMMGERQTDHPALFYEFSLERHVPGDHLLRSIDRFVDLGDIREQLRPFYSDTGRPSVDPELMIRMLIVGYCMGIRSERRLCEEVHLNLAYRWFCRLGLDGAVPDHSTFSKNRHGRFRESDLLRKLFESTVARCIAKGLVGGQGFAVDASMIKADANRQNSTPGDRWEPDLGRLLSRPRQPIFPQSRLRARGFQALPVLRFVLDRSGRGEPGDPQPRPRAGRPDPRPRRAVPQSAGLRRRRAAALRRELRRRHQVRRRRGDRRRRPPVRARARHHRQEHPDLRRRVGVRPAQRIRRRPVRARAREPQAMS